MGREGWEIVVRKAGRYTSAEIHEVLFGGAPPQTPKVDVKEAIRKHIRKRHAAIDTNVLVRLLVRDDPRQLDLAEKFVAKGAWVSQLVLVETPVGARCGLRALTGTDRRGVERLLAHAELTLQDADVVTSALGLFQARPTLDFRTVWYWRLLARRAFPLGTFDRQLGKADGASRIDERRPAA
jgi:predicted nucleic-acid-binding protein